MIIKDFDSIPDTDTYTPGVPLIFGRAIIIASFEEWITHVFDRPYSPRHWRFNEDYVDWALPASETVSFLTKTFEESGTVLSRFTDEQVDDGLRYISCVSLSEIPTVLWEESVPLIARKEAIHSIRTLYTDCFAVRCAPIHSHLPRLETDENALNGYCYMFWDELTFDRRMEHKPPNEIDLECLATMEFTLGLESDACRESGLHGLGHWVNICPEFVQTAIDRFIKATPNASPELINYALRAREVKVL